MCGRFTIIASADVISRALGVTITDKQLSFYCTSRGYNVAPTQTAPIVLMRDGQRQVVPALWGFHPPWAQENAPTPINARAETLFSKPYFRDAVKRKRCLVPTTGWYEWWEMAPSQKQPYFIRPTGAEVFAFAGLYAQADGAPGHNFAIIVGEATPVLRTLHARQPIVVRQADYESWLNPGTPQEALEGILGHREPDYERTPVSKLVNNPGNDAPEIFGKLL